MREEPINTVRVKTIEDIQSGNWEGEVNAFLSQHKVFDVVTKVIEEHNPALQGFSRLYSAVITYEERPKADTPKRPPKQRDYF